MKAKIYLDFNSTHPPNQLALAEARAFYFEHFANSSGLSLESQQVNKRIESARDEIAGLFGVNPQQIIFTSGATEANNLLIREFSRRRGSGIFRVVTSPFEHPSVSEVLRATQNTQITALPARADGSLETGNWRELCSSEMTDLATVMAVQNESGVVLPLSELVELKPKLLPLLADCSQLVPKLATDAPPQLQPGFIRYLTDHGCFVTATGHKVGAGFGAGLLILPAAKSLENTHPLLAGGNQEHSLRAGSHNTEAIIALSLALRHKLSENSYAKWRERTQAFERLLLRELHELKGVQIIGERSERAPGTSLLMLPGIPIDFLVMALDKAEIIVSTGTSCKSRSRSPSAALLAMGFSEQQALSVIRLSYDQQLTDAEMERAASTIAAAAKALS